MSSNAYDLIMIIKANLVNNQGNNVRLMPSLSWDYLVVSLMIATRASSMHVVIPPAIAMSPTMVMAMSTKNLKV